MKKVFLFFTLFLVCMIASCSNKTYTYKFLNDDGTVLKEKTDKKGAKIIAPSDPTKQGNEYTTYVFKGWDKDFDILTEDIVINAVYEEQKVKFTYTFYDYDQKTIIKQETAPYGSSIEYPADPVREGGEGYMWKFVGWSKNPTTLTENVKIYARYQIEYEMFKVTVLDSENNQIDVIDVEYGTQIIEPDQVKPTKQGYYYVFDGWFDKETGELFDFDTEIKKDYTIYAKVSEYKVVTPLLKDTTISILGDSISTFYDPSSPVNSYYTSDNQFYYPRYSATVKSVTDTWWYQTVTSCSATLGLNNSWSGSTASGSSESAGCSNARLSTLNKNGTPNIVIVFLGTNDNVNGSSSDQVKQAYVKIIEYIYNNYYEIRGNKVILPKIYIFNNGYSAYHGYNYTEERRIEYNKVFAQLAKVYEYVNLFDLASLITKDNYQTYLGDSLHYNALGMKLISENLSKQIIKDYNGENYA